VAELKASMSMRELRDWQRIDAGYVPLPDRLADIHFGMIASIMVNLMRSADAAPATPADYFVIRDREPTVARPQAQDIDRLRRAWRGG
jgi:hypothetical protein